MRVILESQVNTLAYDLRELSQGRVCGAEFWDGLQKVLEKDFHLATEERRQNENIFLPVAVSIRDLINKVKEVGKYF